MKNPNDIIADIENKIDDYVNWKNKNASIKNFRDYSELTANVKDLLKYVAILYPKFILVENNVILEDHYEIDNWKLWREKLNAKDAANMVNHVHLIDYLSNDYQGTLEYEEELANILVYFWQIAVEKQFPEHSVRVEYVGDVIDILNI
jgi:hypothetical protein